MPFLIHFLLSLVKIGFVSKRMASVRMAAEKQRNTKGDKKDKNIRGKKIINGDMEEAELIPSFTMKTQKGQFIYSFTVTINIKSSDD